MVIHQNLRQTLAGAGEAAFREFLQFVPGEDNVVAVHDQVILLDLPALRVFGGFFSAGHGAVDRPFDRSELPVHDLFQCALVQIEAAPGAHLRGRGLHHFAVRDAQTAVHVHEVLHLVPLDVDARAVGTEYGIRGIVRVALRVITDLFDDFRGVVTGEIALEAAGEPPAAFGIGKQLLLIVLHLRDRRGAREQQGVHAVCGTFEFRVHGLDVADGAADAFGRYFQAEAVPGFQQHVSRLHQSLAHGPVRRLAEIAALGVL